MTAPNLTLNTGAPIHAIGLGVFRAERDVTRDAVVNAVKIGYRHIDTAQDYGNEQEVGEGVRDAVQQLGVKREDLFITSKLFPTDFGYDKAKAGVDESLQKLGLDYIDLFLLHAPGDPKLREESWRALEEAHKAGKLRSIGVSNFNVQHLEKLAKTGSLAPAVNQIELSPFLQRQEIVDYCKANNIIVEAYSPLTKGQKLDDPTLKKVADAYNKTTAQVLIKWGLQKGYVTLPKSTTPERQQENFDVFDFTLSDADMQTLDGLEQNLVLGGWTGGDPITCAEV